jgi:hypothetical protein
VINEISTQPGWVELYNTTANAVNVISWQLQTKEQTRSLSGILDPHGFLVVDATIAVAGDTVQLLDNEGAVINTVSYGEGSSLAAPPSLQSVARRIDGGQIWAIGPPTKGISNKTDFLPPSIPSGGTPNGTVETTLDFAFTWQAASDNDGPATYEFRMANNPDALQSGFSSAVEGTSIAFRTNIDAGDGEWYWQVRAVDQSQNYSAWSDVWHVRVDTNGPGMTIEQPQLSQLFGGPASKDVSFVASIIGCREEAPFTLELDGTDVTGQVSSSRDGPDGVRITGSFNANALSDGEHVFRLRAVDDVGNLGEQLRTFVIDKTAPELSANISEGAIIGGNTRLSLLAQEAHPGEYGLTIEHAGETVHLNVANENDMAATTVSGSPVVSYLWDTTTVENGAYELHFRGVDAVGNEAFLTRTVTVNNTPGSGALVPQLSQPTDPLLDQLSKQLTQAFVMPKSLDLTPIEMTSTSDQLSSTGKTTPLVLPATDQNAKLTAVAPSESGWRIFGVLWYWWLLLALTAGLTFRRLRKVSQTPLVERV